MTARHATLARRLRHSRFARRFWRRPISMHLLIQILLWGFVYTAWSMMGRFGFVSLGHGAFMGVGAYVPALLWNYYDVTPWIGIPLGVALAALLGLVIGYPCFRLKVIGHYFALVTLALSQVVLLSIVAARDITGGSLGLTQRAVGFSWYALQFPDKRYFYVIALALWLGGLAVWRAIDRGIGREALDAISEDEEAAAAIGIDVHAREAARHRDQRGAHRARRRDLRPIPHVSQSRDRLRHRRLAADRLRRDRRRDVRDARSDRRRAADDLAERGPARRRSAPISSAPPTRSTASCSFCASSSCRAASSAC